MKTEQLDKRKYGRRRVFYSFKLLCEKNGRLIGTLPYGYNQYSVNGMSIVIDEACMNEGKVEKETSKYFVIRPDCKLYDGWNKEDIIF